MIVFPDVNFSEEGRYQYIVKRVCNGVVTNLDGGESMRAMASIKSELARRQRVFGEHGV